MLMFYTHRMDEINFDVHNGALRKRSIPINNVYVKIFDLIHNPILRQDNNFRNIVIRNSKENIAHDIKNAQ